MKHLGIACTILAVVVALSLWNSAQLNKITGSISSLIDEAAAAAQQDDWDTAAEKAQRAQDTWDSREGYLYLTLRHDNIDAVLVSMREAKSFLETRDLPEFTAACHTATTQLFLLCEMEAFSIKNIF